MGILCSNNMVRDIFPYIIIIMVSTYMPQDTVQYQVLWPLDLVNRSGPVPRSDSLISGFSHTEDVLIEHLSLSSQRRNKWSLSQSYINFHTAPKCPSLTGQL